MSQFGRIWFCICLGLLAADAWSQCSLCSWTSSGGSTTTSDNVGIGAPASSSTRLRLANPPTATETPGSGGQLAFGTGTAQWWIFRTDAANSLYLDGQYGGWSNLMKFDLAGTVAVNGPMTVNSPMSVNSPMTVNAVAGIGAPPYSGTRLRLGNPPVATDTPGSGAQLAFGTSSGQNWAFRLDSNANLHLDRCCWAEGVSFSNSGRLGVGTASPYAKTQVDGGSLLVTGGETISTGVGSPVGVQLRYGTVPDYAELIPFDWSANAAKNLAMRGQVVKIQTGVYGNADAVAVDVNGNVGIGTAGPGTRLDVYGAAVVYGGARRVARLFDTSEMAAGVGGGMDFGGKYNTNGNYTQFANIKGVKATANSGDYVGNFVLSLNDQNGSMQEIVRVTPSATTINGTLTATQVINATYQDVAEWVPASQPLTAGTVVVIDPGTDNGIMPSSRAYDTAVAGVVSAQPGVLLGSAGEAKEKIATTGRVKVSADASRAPIRRGDLLVTSDKPGRAMKSEPIDISGVLMHRPGTVIGKALEPLASGQGEILVLLSLQ